jgi:hypothetical protein
MVVKDAFAPPPHKVRMKQMTHKHQDKQWQTSVEKAEVTLQSEAIGVTFWYFSTPVYGKVSNSVRIWYNSVPIWYKLVNKSMKCIVNESSKEEKTKMEELRNKRINVNSRYTWLHSGTGLVPVAAMNYNEIRV